MASIYFTSYGNEHEHEVFFDCNSDPEHDMFNLRIPSNCEVKSTHSWHLEFKKIYRYHRNNQTCTESLSMLFVSNEYVILPVPDSENDKEFLLLSYEDLYKEEHPKCIPTDKNYHKFNYDIFIDVNRNHYWEKKSANKKNVQKKTIDPVILRSIGDYNEKNLESDALILGFQSLLYAKAASNKFNIFQKEIILEEESGNIFGALKKKLFGKKNEKTVHYADVKHYFNQITKHNLTNEIINNTKIYTEIVRTLETKVNDLAVLYFEDACKVRNEKIRHFSVGSIKKADEKIRMYLGRKDVAAIEIRQNEEYIVSRCEEVQPEKIFHDYKIDEICYKLLPVLKKGNILMFADTQNYLHHYSIGKSCHSIFHFGESDHVFKEGEMSWYESTVDFIIGGLSGCFKWMVVGWWSSFPLKYKIYFQFASAIVMFTLLGLLLYFLNSWGVFVITESTYNTIRETVKLIFELLSTMLDGITGILSSFNNCLAENRKRRHQKRDKTRKEISELRNKEIQEHIKKIQENPNNDTFIDIPHI